jgi:dephospho-CoA kinase
MKKAGRPGIKLGVTGGIGSGKTSVCRVFKVLGIPVFAADFEAKDIMDNDESVKDKINSIAGKDLYSEGVLDRPGLATLIFNNKILLEKVNSLIHPIVFDHFSKWESMQNAPYVIMEAAILFESGAVKLVDRIATVIAPDEEKIERVIRRNNLTREQILERMESQISDEDRISRSDYLIYNSEKDMIIPAILKIHEELVMLSNTDI